MKNRVPVLTAVSVLLCVAPAKGHNGEVAYAAPATNIVVDGDLSEWPPDATQYEIHRTEVGVPPVDGADFQGHFRVAWDPAAATLFVAVDILDDDIQITGEPIVSWRQMREALGRQGWRSRDETQDPPDLPDGCAIIVDVGDRRQPRRFSLDGAGMRSTFDTSDEDLANWPGVQSAQHVATGRRQYEWRVDLNALPTAASDSSRVVLVPGTAIGFDVTVVDRDEDGSLSWVTWGPGVDKVRTRGDARGDLVLLGTAVSLRDVAGHAEWTDSLAVTVPHAVAVKSVDHGARWLADTDPAGHFNLQLLPGDYVAVLEDPRLGRDLQETNFAVPGTGTVTEVVVRDRPLFRMSALTAQRGDRPAALGTPNLPAGKQRGVSWVGSRIIGRAELAPLVPVFVDWIMQTPFGWQSDIHLPTLRVPTGDAGLWGESDRGVAITAALARERGIATLLKPHLWTGRGTWRGELAMTSEQDWATWFAQYERFIVHFARLAEANGIEGFCIGAELSATLGREAEWRRVIERVRQVYGGWLVYAANWTNFEDVPFWDAVDFIGVQAYFPLSAEPTQSVDELIQGWQPWLARIEAVAQQSDRRVLFTEIGYRTNTNAAVEPWLWERQTQGGGDIEGQVTQEALYEAFFRAAWSRPWVAGAYFWKWFPDHEQAGGDGDEGFTPQRKPAQLTLTNWYRRSLVLEARGEGTPPVTTGGD